MRPATPYPHPFAVRHCPARALVARLSRRVNFPSAFDSDINPPDETETNYEALKKPLKWPIRRK